MNDAHKSNGFRIHAVAFPLLIGLLMLFASCAPYGGIAWSPEGGRAAYTDPAGVGHLTDREGNLTADLGKAIVGGYSWSDDGKVLFFVRADIKPRTAPAPGKPAINPGLDDYTLCRWSGEKIETVLQTHDVLMTTAVSPGGRWVAVTGGFDPMQKIDSHNVGACRVWDTVTRKFHPICDRCGLRVTFTGPNRCVMVEADLQQPPSPNNSTPIMIGKLVEFDVTPFLEGKPVTKSVLDDGQCVVDEIPIGSATGDPLFTKVNDERGVILYRWEVKTGKTVKLIDAPVLFATISPDRSRVLMVNIDSALDKKFSLRVVDVDGRNEKVLTADPPFTGLDVAPVWHTSDLITFESQGPVDLTTGKPVHFDLVDYRILPDGKLRPERVLSKDWPIEIKLRANEAFNSVGG